MNVVSYDNFTFDDNSIISGKLNLANALAFDSLVPDEMTIEVVSNDTGRNRVMVQPRPEDAEQVLNWYTTTDERGYVVMTNDIRQYVYGTPVEYTYDGNLIGKFYLKNVVRLSANTWRINMISAVGLWVNMMHLGGVYNGTTAGEIIADILDGVTYTIDSDVAAVPMYGWLPVASARDNLQQVLFAIGASITKTSDGTPRIQFLKNLPTVSIPDERVFIGGSIDYRTPATQVEVTEHIYYKSSYGQTVSLYDNADGTVVADNTLITFSEPCYDLMWMDGGAQVETSVADLGWTYGDNYCYVTGVGILSGTKYTHSEKVRSVSTGVSGESNIKRVENATLVSPINSPNVAARVAAYYGKTDATSCGIILTDNSVKPGTKVSFTDPYDSTSETGIVETMDVTLSGNLKADASILKGYTPSNFGNTYRICKLLWSGTPFELPSTTRKIKLVIGQGGYGGQGGYNGTAGSSGKDFHDNPYDNPGVGGAAGAGGTAGKVYEVEVTLAPFRTWSVRLSSGSSGSGGSANGGAGYPSPETEVLLYQNGTAYARYTSESGEHRNGGFYEIFSGKTYSIDGADGVAGGDGGYGSSTTGQNVIYPVSNGRYQESEGGKAGEKWENTYNPNRTRYAMGGNGGGAAAWQDGNDGGPGGADEYTTRAGIRRGGKGGDGANAAQPLSVELGCGGYGGNGGGGGGTGGWYVYDETTSGPTHTGYGVDGAGGSGSVGGRGGGPYVIIYY